jgi:hypothetical protein
VPHAVTARHFSPASCLGHAACRDGMPPSKLLPETLIKNPQNNFQMITADFQAENRKPNRESRSLRAFLKRIAGDINTATVDFPARQSVRKYSPRPRTTLLNNYVHCPHPPTSRFFWPSWRAQWALPTPPHFGGAKSKCHLLHDTTQNHRRVPMAKCSRDPKSHDLTQPRMMRKSQGRNASPLASRVTQCSIGRSPKGIVTLPLEVTNRFSRLSQ